MLVNNGSHSQLMEIKPAGNRWDAVRASMCWLCSIIVSVWAQIYWVLCKKKQSTVSDDWMIDCQMVARSIGRWLVAQTLDDVWLEYGSQRSSHGMQTDRQRGRKKEKEKKEKSTNQQIWCITKLINTAHQQLQILTTNNTATSYYKKRKQFLE